MAAMFDEVYRLREFLGSLSLLHAVIGRWLHAPATAAGPARDARRMQQASLCAWQAMRAVAGLLHAHPSARFHPANIRRRSLILRWRAATIAMILIPRSLRYQWLLNQLERQSWTAANIRAVSLSLSLSTALARIQTDFRQIHIELRELQKSLRHAQPQPLPRAQPRRARVHEAALRRPRGAAPRVLHRASDSPFT